MQSQNINIMYMNSKISSKPKTHAKQGKEENCIKICNAVMLLFANIETITQFGTIFVATTQNRKTQDFDIQKTLVERERERERESF